MSANGLTLEEYITFIKQYPYGGKPLQWSKDGQTMEIFYVEADRTGMTSIKLPEDSVYLVSGNNVDGFIVTRHCQ